MSRENSPTLSNTSRQHDLPGDPNCPVCHGIGYLRADLPVGHPDFGKLQPCSCRLAEIGESIRKHLYALSQLNDLKDLTFDTFHPNGRMGIGAKQAESVKSAFNQSQMFANHPVGWLVLQGKYGCGKTHLAAAIANFAVTHGTSTLFITVPDLLDTLRFSYSNPDTSFEERFEEIRRSPLLILDDFGTQNATAWAQEKLFQILNFRYINHLPLVVTTNLTMKEVEGRIRSRLQDPELVTRLVISAPDYRRPKDDTGHPELSSLQFLANRTFGNYSDRKGEGIAPQDLKSLDKAYRAAKAFAKSPSGWLVLTGPFGCGKTHLAAAIANLRAGEGFPPLFVVVPDLLDHLRATFNPESNVRYDRRFDEVRTAPLLILDDLGTQSMTPWTREKLYQLFNYRYITELPTVITTADEFNQIDPRLQSRMLDQRLCTVYAITMPAYHSTQLPKHKKRRGR